MKNYILILFSLFLAACGSNKTEEEQDKPLVSDNIIKLDDKQMLNAGIMTGHVEHQSISSVLKVNGKIDVPPQNMVSISIPLGGFLKSTQLLPGMKVKKGEVIAVMEDQQYVQLQQDYLTARVKSVFLTKEYERQKELNLSKASSDKVLQQAESDYRSQVINERSLAEKLKLIHIDPNHLDENSISKSITITAPIDGYVTKVNANIGKYVNPSDVLFELVNPSDIHLNLTVFERDIDKLYVGQKLVAYTNHEPDKKHKCEILLIGQNLSSERNIEVHCHFDDYDRSLIPGMYMNAQIEVKAIDADVLPDDAILFLDGVNYVFVEKAKNTFELRKIVTGVNENGFTQVTAQGGLDNGKVVIKGAYSLLMAMKNKPEE